MLFSYYFDEKVDLLMIDLAFCFRIIIIGNRISAQLQKVQYR